MSIESKTKTAQRITFENHQSVIKSDSKWVPLEAAQKEIIDRDIWIKKLQGKLETEPYALANQLVKMTNKAIEAEAKIEAANTVLMADANHIKDVMKWNPDQTYPAENVLRLVQEVLDVLIPRKEESETK